MKAPALLLSAAAALLLTVRGSAAHNAPAAQAATGKVIQVQGRSALLETASGAVLPVPLTHAMTADGHTLAASDLRPGDRLTVTAGHAVRDDSQVVERVRGLIAVGPASARDPLVVQLGPSWSIVADTTSSTRYTDLSHRTQTAGQLIDSDQVDLRGIYDTALGEMTQTVSITRLGPFPKGAHR